jgi:hypothetical protein
MVGIIGGVGEHQFWPVITEQSGGLGDIATLAARQDEARRAAKPTHGHVNFCAQAALSRRANRKIHDPHVQHALRGKWHRAPLNQSQASMD